MNNLADWSIYVHEDDPRWISIRHKDRPGDTLLKTSDGSGDQEQVRLFVEAVNEAKRA